MQVFEYLVIRVVPREERIASEVEESASRVVQELLDGPKAIIARNAQNAHDRALVAVARSDKTASMCNVEILVRPFCR